MIWIYLIIIAVVIGLLVMHYSKPSVFARSIAMTQLKMLRRIQKQSPELVGESLYTKVLSYRSGYGKIEITQIMDEAHKKAHDPIQFKDVVLALAEHEYFKLRGHGSTFKDIQSTKYGKIPIFVQHLFIIKAVVDETVPSDL